MPRRWLQTLGPEVKASPSIEMNDDSNLANLKVFLNPNPCSAERYLDRFLLSFQTNYPACVPSQFRWFTWVGSMEQKTIKLKRTQAIWVGNFLRSLSSLSIQYHPKRRDTYSISSFRWLYRSIDDVRRFVPSLSPLWNPLTEHVETPMTRTLCKDLTITRRPRRHDTVCVAVWWIQMRKN